jgi:hypothetical protein
VQDAERRHGHGPIAADVARRAGFRGRGTGNSPNIGWLYFKSEDEGDGTYDGQIGHAYLHLDDDASEDEDQDLGFITLARAVEIARENGVELDVDGPTRKEWDAPPRRSLLDRLFGR